LDALKLPSNVADMLGRYRNMLSRMSKLVNDHGQCLNDQRSVVAMTLMDLAHDHAQSITILIEERYYSSAAALLRAQYEAFLRGSWVRLCATEEELKWFVQKDALKKEGAKRLLDAKQMVRDLESVRDWEGSLEDIHEHVRTILNSFTHGGMHQVMARFDGKSITPTPDFEQLCGTIQFSALIAFQGFCQIAEVSQSHELSAALDEIAPETRQWMFPSKIQSE
jgi:hypothetical protein